jgi:hypothetical protein
VTLVWPIEINEERERIEESNRKGVRVLQLEV